MRGGNARVGGSRDARRHSRHDLVGDAGGAQRERLLAAAPEDKRVAALQAHDGPALARAGDHQLLRVALGDRVAAAPLADEDHLGVRARAGERTLGDQPVMQDHVGLRDQLDSAHREQGRVSRTGADEIDAAAHVRIGQSTTSSTLGHGPGPPRRADLHLAGGPLRLSQELCRAREGHPSRDLAP